VFAKNRNHAKRAYTLSVLALSALLLVPAETWGAAMDEPRVLVPNLLDVGRTFDIFHVPRAATELRILNTDKGTISGYYDDRETFVSAVQFLAGRGPATFVTINPCHPDLLARAHNHVTFYAKLTTADPQIIRRRVALIDVDAVRISGISATDTEHYYAIERIYEIERALREEGFPELALGDSGNGGHGLLALDLPNDDDSRDLLQCFLKVLARRFDDGRVKIDQSVYNAARIAKVYGTPVCKGDNLPDRPHRLSRWLKIPQELHPVPVELLKSFAGRTEPFTGANANSASPPGDKRSHGKRKFVLDEFIARNNIQTRPPEPRDGGRIFRLYACVFNPEHEAKDAAIIERADGTLCYHCFHSSCSDKSWHDVRELFEGPRTRRNGSSPPPQSPASSPPSPEPEGPGFPTLNAGDYQLRDIVLESLTALRVRNLAALTAGQDNSALYTRGGRIVEIVQVDGRTVILDATDSMVRRYLSLAANYIRYTKIGPVGVPPPSDVTRGVIDSHPAENWGLMPVDAIVEVPAFRPDGTIIEREGYDASSRLYYAPGPGLKNIRVPPFPTDAEVRAARELLQEPFLDFPFVDDASRTNVIAALVTLFVRPLIRGCVPALALDAVTQGSGKTLIVKIIALVLTGQDAILHAAPKEQEEWRKKLTAVLRYGPALVVFDNLIHPLSSDALSCALTSGVYADRILGVSETVEMPVRCLIVCTGNNLRAVGDMERRVFWARQNPKVPDPENRSEFKIPELEQWVLAHRVNLIEAILTLIRAWFAAGQPRADLRRGSFDDWAQKIGGILKHAGIDHFLENRTASYAVDGDISEFGAFLLEIKEVLNGPFLTIELVKILNDRTPTYGKLHEALPDWMREKSKDEGQFCAFLGNVFNKRLDKRNRPSGVYITREGHTGGRARWKIVVPGPVTLNIKGKGKVTFDSQEAADAFRAAHPEVVE
jgi:hypothetical protein